MNRGWQYNFYHPGESSFSFAQVNAAANSALPANPVVTPNRLVCETTCPSTASVQPSSCSVGLKVFNPTNKRDFVMLKLREVSDEDFSSPTSLRKLILQQAGEEVVSRDLSFPLGFFSKSDKFWIRSDMDMKDVKEAFLLGRLTLWCVGVGEKSGKKKRKESDSDDELEGMNSRKRKRTTVEERAAQVEEIRSELRQKHGSTFSGVQYALWAEMVAAGTHESKDNPPSVPMFGSNRPRGRSNRFEETLTDVAGKIVTALSPPPLLPSSGDSQAAELRGKYIHQLKELLSLKEMGGLTENEYEEQRSIVVNLMRKL